MKTDDPCPAEHLVQDILRGESKRNCGRHQERGSKQEEHNSKCSVSLGPWILGRLFQRLCSIERLARRTRHKIKRDVEQKGQHWKTVGRLTENTTTTCRDVRYIAVDLGCRHCRFHMTLSHGFTYKTTAFDTVRVRGFGEDDLNLASWHTRTINTLVAQPRFLTAFSGLESSDTWPEAAERPSRPANRCQTRLDRLRMILGGLLTGEDRRSFVYSVLRF